MENEIPKQEHGSKMDAAADVQFGDEIKAMEFYQVSRMRLLEVYNWDKLCGYASATFILTDATSQHLKRAAREGDYIKIDIPGPGTVNGDGFDWVTVEQIHEESAEHNQMVSMRVRPCANPRADSDEVAHFFKDEATSTFMVSRIGTEVIAEMHGRNEMPNTDAKGVVDKVRNVAVGLSAKVGFSYPQWKVLVEALVARK